MFVNTRENEKGSILLLTAFLAIVLLAVIGLLIDSAILAASKTAQEQVADFAVLRAMEGYTSDPTADIPTRITNAANAAGRAVDVNVSSVLGQQYGEGTTTWSAVGTPTAAGENGVLIPGVWYFEQPSDPAIVGSGCVEWLGSTEFVPDGFGLSSACPCDGGTWGGACFQPVNPATASINAMQLAVFMDSGDGIRPQFAQIYDAIGGSNYSTNGIELTSVATSTLVPRRLLFIVDISPSIAGDSHPNPLVRPYASSALADITSASVPPYGTFLQDCGTDPWPGSQPAALPAGTTRCKAFTPAEVPGDVSVDIDGDTTDDIVFTAPIFRIDDTLDAEPLKGILTAAHHMMYDLRNRSIGADRFGFIGFDENILPIRATWDSGRAEPVLVEPTSTEFDEFFEATKVETLVTYSDGSTDAGDMSNADDRFLFPRFYSGAYSFGPKNTADHDLLSSNLGAPLMTSLRAFASSSNGTQATSHAFLFTDGLTFCVVDMANHPLGAFGRQCMTGFAPVNIAALNEVIGFIAQAFEERQVALHVFLAGAGVRPHTLIRKGEAGEGCLSDQDARILAKDRQLRGRGNSVWTRHISHSRLVSNSTACGGAARDDTCYPTGVNITDNPAHVYSSGAIDESINNPWVAPNLLYYAAARTGGVFIPLRPPCNAQDPSNDSHQTDLENGCNASGARTGNLLDDSDFSTLAVTAADGSSTFANYIDSEGRLLCDPSNRSIGEQVSEAIADILGQNPFILVAEQ